MTLNRLHLWHGLQLLFALSLGIFLIYCFHFNADLTDEGFYFYYFQKGYDAVAFNFYHLFFAPIGSLFSHKLIGYRYLSLVLISISSTCLYVSIDKERKSPWLIPLILGTFYFNLISTFSYNTVVLCGGGVVLGLLARLTDSKLPKLLSVALGFVCFLTFSARFGVGVLMLVLSAIYFYLVIPNKRKALILGCLSMATFGSLLCGFLFLYPHAEGMFEILSSISSSSHQGMMGEYTKHFLRFFGRAYLPAIAIIHLSRKYIPSAYLYVICSYVGWFVFAHILRDYEYTSFWYYISGLLAALATVEILIKKRFKIKALDEGELLSLLALVFYFISSIGTNNNPFKAASYNCLFLFPVIFHFSGSKLSNQKLLTFFLVLLCGLGIYRKQYFQSYRSKPRSEQVFVKSSMPGLESIHLDEKLESKLKNVQSELVKRSFDKSKDRILTFPNMPGVVSYLGLTALGNPWNFDDYLNSSVMNCAYIMQEPIFAGRLFIYSEKDIPGDLLKCIKMKAQEIIYLK